MGFSRRRIAQGLCLALSIVVLSLPLWLHAADDDFEKWQDENAVAFEDFVSDEQKAFNAYQKEIERQWQVFVGSSQKDWVSYSKNQSTRSVVDFERGEITFETVILVDKKMRPTETKTKSLDELARQKIVQRLRDILLDKSVLGKSPIAGQLELKDGVALGGENLSQFVDQSLKKKIKIDPLPYVAKDGKKRVKARVRVKMMPEHLKFRAEKFRKPVERYSKKYGVEKSLVMAVIHTESYFNPKARSRIPAYGLMQLVPKSGGRDAYRRAHGKDRIPSSGFLYDPNNNIELGTAYLKLLAEREFKGVKNTESKGYLIIAAYNTGAGNVSRAFTGKKKLTQATKKINKMSPSDVFALLKRALPYQETRNYIQKVVKRRAIYEDF